MTCPKCSAMGLPALRILDILVPEVFLSYNWGVPVHDAEVASSCVPPNELVRIDVGFVSIRMRRQ